MYFVPVVIWSYNREPLAVRSLKNNSKMVCFFFVCCCFWWVFVWRLEKNENMPTIYCFRFVLLNSKCTSCECIQRFQFDWFCTPTTTIQMCMKRGLCRRHVIGIVLCGPFFDNKPASKWFTVPVLQKSITDDSLKINRICGFEMCTWKRFVRIVAVS